MNKTFTPNSFVTTERGSRLRASDPIRIDDNVSSILHEMHQFRTEIISRLESQMIAYEQLQGRFQKTETELMELKKCIEAKNSEEVECLKNQINILKLKNEHLESCLNNIKTSEVKTCINNRVETSYAKVLSRDKAEVVVPSQQGGASKQAILPENVQILNKDSSKITENKSKEVNRNDWIEVKKRKYKYSKNEVKKGDNTRMCEIQGMEKKKFIHVWRLEKNTTIENMENHLQKICGEVSFKNEKLKPKTERDYSSFMIGVPESMYDKVCRPDVWPLNVEFSEWVWFRKTNAKPK
ncbi:unnamed protein product [Diatraea saccharalis]|uniref:Uncharacterized protein n=1 Tax=Diatraea saccharalis TaxID=40085 RepID=A0A9N9R947_9NEOP|nr:unnamed protein product [Diatraea saccharalis]